MIGVACVFFIIAKKAITYRWLKMDAKLFKINIGQIKCNCLWIFKLCSGLPGLSSVLLPGTNGVISKIWSPLSLIPEPSFTWSTKVCYVSWLLNYFLFKDHIKQLLKSVITYKTNPTLFLINLAQQHQTVALAPLYQ